MLMQASGLYKVQSASDTFPEELVISNWYKHQGRHHDGEKVDCPFKTTVIVLVQVQNVMKCIKFQEEWIPAGSQVLGPWVH